MATIDPSLVTHLPLFAGFSADALGEILREARSVRFAKNSAVFQQGEEANSFYVLLHGHVRKPAREDFLAPLRAGRDLRVEPDALAVYDHAAARRLQRLRSPTRSTASSTSSSAPATRCGRL